MATDDRRVVRWGFLSTARIAIKAAKSVNLAPNAVLTAVASRDVAKARAFIDAYAGGAADACTYDELLDRADVDAVYIPLPTGIRKEWVLKAAGKGKHVLCEKPTAPCMADLVDMIAACKANGVQFMDGVMFMHNPRMAAVQARMREGVLGDMRRVTSAFSFPTSEEFLAQDIRFKKELEPLGCLGDLGWYTTRVSLFFNGYDMPAEVLATHVKLHDGVPLQFDATLYWADGRIASFETAFTTAFRQWVEAAGTEGTVSYSDLCLSAAEDEVQFEVRTKAQVGLSSVSYALDTVVVKTPLPQEALLMKHFGDLVTAVKEDKDAPDMFWPTVSLKTQAIMDACMASAASGKKEPVPPLPEV